MKDRETRFLKMEIAKLLQEKLFMIFIVLCICVNTALCFADNYAREWLNHLSAEEFLQNGEKIYHEISGAGLGTAYYNQRYIHSSILNQKMKEKYDRLQTSIDRLDEADADLSFYAGEMTPIVHKALFQYQLKALLIENVILIALLCMRAFSMERNSETASLIYSSRRGRKIAKDKIFANGVVGFGYCFVLCLVSLMTFFNCWDFSNLWDGNVSSSFHYVNDMNEPIYMKPFITWTSLTVKEYFVCSMLLIGVFLIVWWLICNIMALFIHRDLLGGLGITAILVFPYFGLILFPGWNLTIPFYLSTLSLSTVIFYNHMWFTDLGNYSLAAYQEVGIVFAHLVIAILAIGFAMHYFQRKELV